MKKFRTLFLKTIFFSFACFITPQTSFARIEEEADRRIDQLNDSISTIGLFGVEKVIGKLPSHAKPRSGFIAKWNFHADGPKILKLIEILEQQKEHEECARCLNAINEIFYLQLRQLLVELDVGQADGLQLGMKGMDVAVKGSKKKKKLFGVHSANYVKSKLLEILFKIYDCQNTRDIGLAYSYESLPIALIMTKATINILRARAHRNWSYEKQKDFVVQKLDRAKKELLIAFGQGRSYMGLSVDELFGFFDILKTIVVVFAQGCFSWGKAFKWTLIAAGIAAASAAAVYGAYLVSSSFGKAALEEFRELPASIEGLRTDFRGIRYEGVRMVHVHEIGPTVEAKFDELITAVDELITAVKAGVPVRLDKPVKRFLNAARKNWLESKEKGSFLQFLDAAREGWFESDPGAFTKFLDAARENWFESPPGPTTEMIKQIARLLKKGNSLPVAIKLWEKAGKTKDGEKKEGAGFVNATAGVVGDILGGTTNYLGQGVVKAGAYLGEKTIQSGVYGVKKTWQAGKFVVGGVINKMTGAGEDGSSEESGSEIDD